MSFEDLPPDWPHLPLGDPVLAHDVLDLCVTHANRTESGLCMLVLHSDLTLAQPVFVAGALPSEGRRAALTNLLEACCQGKSSAAFVAGIAHEHSALSDADRALHQEIIEVCRELGHTLVSSHLVTANAIELLPATRRAA